MLGQCHFYTISFYYAAWITLYWIQLFHPRMHIIDMFQSRTDSTTCHDWLLRLFIISKVVDSEQLQIGKTTNLTWWLVIVFFCPVYMHICNLGTKCNFITSEYMVCRCWVIQRVNFQLLLVGKEVTNLLLFHSSG